MSTQERGEGWWLASDGNWYPPAEPVAPAIWDGNAWMCTDAAGIWMQWDGARWVAADTSATSGPTHLRAEPAPGQRDRRAPGAPPEPDLLAAATADNNPSSAVAAHPKRPRLVAVGVVAAALLIVASVSLVAVRSRADNDAEEVALARMPAGADADPSGVTLTPDTVVVRGGTSIVRAVTDDHTQYTLDGQATGVAALSEGKVALIAGIDAGRVKSINRHDGIADVTLDPVSIEEVIQDGDLNVTDSRPTPETALMFIGPPIIDTGDGAPDPVADESPDPATPDDRSAGSVPPVDDDPMPATSRPVPPGTAKSPETTRPSLRGASFQPVAGTTMGRVGRRAPAGMVEVPRSAWSGGTSRALSMKIGQWEVQVSKRPGTGLDLDAVFRRGFGEPKKGVNPPTREDPETRKGFDKDSGLLQLGVEVHFHLDQPSTSAGVHVRSGAPSAELSTPLNGFIEGTFFAGKEEKDGTVTRKVVVRVPIAYEWMMLAGPIPWYVSLQANALVQPSIPTVNTGMSAPFRVEFSGNGAMVSKGGKTSDNGTKMKATSTKDPLEDGDHTASIGAIGTVHAIQVKVGLGIGSTAFVLGARAGPYIDIVVSAGFVSASLLATVPCVNVSLTLSVGGGFEVRLKRGQVGAKYTTRVDLWKPPNKEYFRPKVDACAPKKK